MVDDYMDIMNLYYDELCRSPTMAEYNMSDHEEQQQQDSEK